jgi:predicted TPR repeat methyltransferase
VTALRRLGQIALSRGDDPAARALLTTAHARAPRQAATRQMLGELCAVAGDIDGAARWWAETGNAHGQLDARAWWYGHIGDVTAQERIRQVIDRLERDDAGRR